MPEILKPGTEISEDAMINRAVTILTDGGIIAYPTETFYGLGVDATHEEATGKIFAVKGRNFKNPVSLIIAKPEDINMLVTDVPETAKKLIDAFWPGALTIVFQASDTVSPLLTAGTGKIGLRVSSHPIALKIVQNMKKPLTATSANLSGAPECSTASEVAGQIGGKIDAILDGGKTPGGASSTLIDVTLNPPVVLREGSISRQSIKEHLHVI
ncbi:MAG TPA: L-threonylcarbamoyladenylate synthase [Smithella sp.]|nr:L-threonylcarbamoyladenylate synthase [Smithella sp.]